MNRSKKWRKAADRCEAPRFVRAPPLFVRAPPLELKPNEFYKRGACPFHVPFHAACIELFKGEF